MTRSQTTLKLIARTFDRVRKEPDREAAARVLTRSTAIVGQMLEGIADRRRLTKRPGTMLARAGRLGWFLVEVATPHSLGRLLFGYWLVLLYVAALIMVSAGLLGAEPAVFTFGLEFLVTTVAVHVATWALNLWFRHHPVRRVIAGAVSLLGIAVLAAYLANHAVTWIPLDTTMVRLRNAAWAIPIAFLLFVIVASGWVALRRLRAALSPHK